MPFGSARSHRIGTLPVCVTCALAHVDDTQAAVAYQTIRQLSALSRDGSFVDDDPATRPSLP